jgi:hypothetical protein
LKNQNKIWFCILAVSILFLIPTQQNRIIFEEYDMEDEIPKPVSQLATELRIANDLSNNSIVCVRIHGEIALVGNGYRLELINVTDPENPLLMSKLALLGPVSDIELYNDVAYVCAGAVGFYTIDISNPYNPIILDCYNTPGVALDIAVKDNTYLLLADDSGDRRGYDASNPENIVSTFGWTSDYDWSFCVDYKDNLMFTGSDYSFEPEQIVVTDVTNMYDAIPIDSDIALSGRASDIDVWNNTLWVSVGSGGIQLINVTDPYNCATIGSYDTDGSVAGIDIIDGIAYVCDGGAGLKILNITNRDNIVQEGSIDTNGFTTDVTVAGNIAYIADSEGGFKTLDISDFAHIQLLGEYNSSLQQPFSLDVENDILYIGDIIHGLRSFNISNPLNLIPLDSFGGLGNPYNIEVDGDYAYVGGSSNLYIVNITDPKDMSLAGSVNIGSSIHEVKVIQNTAFIANSGGLTTINVTNHSDPEILDTFAGSYDGLDILSEDIIVTVSQTQINTFNVSDPTDIIRLDYLDISSYYLNDVAVLGNYAYCIDDYEGLIVVNISNPKDIRESATEDPTIGGYNYYRKIVVSGNYAFITQRLTGIHTINITNPLDPVYMMQSPYGIDACGVSFYEEYILVAGYNSGFYVLEHDFDNDGIYTTEEKEYGLNHYNDDTDGDLIPDGWEINNGLDPNNPLDALDDPDNDNLITFYEYGNNTDPWNPDTDGDNMPDGWEVLYNLLPLDDSDNISDIEPDGLINIYEYGNNTDPRVADCDDDNLLDGEEIITYNTDPLNNDTDFDNLPDGWEVINLLDPNNRFDNITDPDDDDVLNIHEYGNSTDPNNPDTDYDSLPELWEIVNNLDPTNGADNMTDIEPDGLNNLMEYGNSTNPWMADSDGDGLNDLEEVTEGVDQYITDPTDWDSDGDLLNDYWEWKNKTDPWDSDTDNDNLDDLEECIHGLDGYITNASDSDSDSDGLEDYWEWQNATDPWDPDTDSDNFNDITEINMHTSPINPSWYPMPNLLISLFEIQSVGSRTPFILNFTIRNNGIWSAINIRVIITSITGNFELYDNEFSLFSLIPGESRNFEVECELISMIGTYPVRLDVDPLSNINELYCNQDGTANLLAESDNSMTTNLMISDGFFADLMANPITIPAMILGAVGIGAFVVVISVKKVKNRQLDKTMKKWKNMKFDEIPQDNTKSSFKFDIDEIKEEKSDSKIDAKDEKKSDDIFEF